MQIRKYQDTDSQRWDDFCSHSHNACFLHTRHFISYHGDRFTDHSVIVEDEDRNIGALFLAAQANDDDKTVISHPGITYGGLIVDGSMYGERLVSVLEKIRDYYSSKGYSRLLYKVVPYIYHKIPSQDDLYALFRTGAKRYRCDITATIDLSSRAAVSSRRKRSLKKANKNNIKVETGDRYAKGVWGVLESNLASKHDAIPAHTLEEISLLKKRFPDNIIIKAAVADNEVIAGLVLFQTDMVSHAQYIASNETGQKMCALDLLFDNAIDCASRDGRRYFDFGISNENDGMVLNQSLYQFKHEFGSGGAVHEFYMMDLKG